MKIDGHTMVLGLMGDPVEHTLSPLIQNIFADALKINAVYEAFHVKAGDTKNALNGGFSLGIQGFNVTVPHKEALIPFLDSIDPAAGEIGAVNTLVRTERGYRGYNTDYIGIKREMEKSGFDISGEKVIMLGAGGAANAVLFALYELGASGVYIINRSADRARDKFGSDGRNIILSPDRFPEIPGDGYFCVQCTSVGLAPDADLALIEDPAFYEKIDRAVDLIYNPAETRFMKMVKKAGGRAENGLYMLLFQAAESFRLFTGTEVENEALKAAESALLSIFG